MLNTIYLKKLLSHNSVYWKLLFWLILTLLLALTLTPQNIKLVNVSHIDKFYHFIAFAGFSFVFAVAYQKASIIFIISNSFALGILIEIAQSYIPNRGFSYADIAADLLGAIAGLIIARLLLNQIK